MYSFTRIFNCNFTEFDNLFYQSEPLIDPYVWQVFSLVDSPKEERLQTMKDTANKWLQSPSVIGTYVVNPEGLPIKVDVGAFRVINKKNYLYTNLTFNGADSSGSKAWLHSIDFIEQAMEFYKTLKVEGRIFPLKKNTVMYNHLTGYSTDKFYYTEEPQEGDDVLLYLHYL